MTTQIQQDRIANNSEFTAFADELTNAQWFTKYEAGKFLVKAYVGRKLKPVFYYSFSDITVGESYINKWLSGLTTKALKAQAIKQEKAELLKQPLKIEIGDVFYCSWGWEQTNTFFLEVVKKVGKRSVVVREIASIEVEHNPEYMNGKVSPSVGNYVGEEMTKRVGIHNDIKLSSFQHAWLLGYTEVDGKRVYEEKYFSYYG